MDQTWQSCPRCGDHVPLVRRGRPRRWCSDRCRRRASDERQAAAHRDTAVRVHEIRRTVVTERVRPMTPDEIVAATLRTPHLLDAIVTAAVRGLQNGTFRRTDRAGTRLRRHIAYEITQLAHLYADLAHGELGETLAERAARADPEAEPTLPIELTRVAAVHQVLADPRATQEVLRALRDRARAGQLVRGDNESTATIRAARQLYDELRRAGQISN
ncbi:hypothetical protein [Nocardia sp. NPDC057227]|uniref:hypothetical protein n=1 Tax=Nocardia sp. NPDC057227 TaxID=3346056 RepID=UPI00363401E7